MDNSQSSNVFSDSEDFSSDSAVEAMDTVTYDNLLANTKRLLSPTNILKEIHKPSFGAYFSTVLNDCRTCVTQSLDLVLDLLTNTDIIVPRLCGYLDDAVSILHLLSGFITTAIESVAMSCCNMQMFPVTTGNILKTIFVHCKDSELIYGNNLKNVEKQLKDLFRTCHELQLTYLMVLEKHFTFDLTKSQELSILVKALGINLEIGEIVQVLDVKTMAEQWKAITMICEKHKDYLMDTLIYRDCSKILCSVVEKHLQTALEMQQEEKIILRSLKVANFTIKILLRVHNIFKHATEKNYGHIVDLLLNIYLNNPSYLTLICNQPRQFINLIIVNVLNPSHALLKELVEDEKFVNHLHNIKLESLKNDDKLLSYIMLILSAIQSILQGNNIKDIKYKMIECVFKWLPHGHIWVNMGLRFEPHINTEYHSYSLHEHLLTHTFALATILDSDEMNLLEKKMYESVLSTDCYSALFASNLWELLASSSPRQFILNQFVSICKGYQTLENYKLFHRSPQYVHIRATLRKLFKTLHTEDKFRVYKLFNINDEKNYGLWSALEIQNLPEDLRSKIEGEMVEKLQIKLHKAMYSAAQSSEQIYSLTKLMNLVPTCSFVNQVDTLDDYIIVAWTKACPNSGNFLLQNALDQGTVWYYNYMESLVTLTIALNHILCDGANMIKVLHVILNIIQGSNTEVKLVLIKLFFRIILTQVCDENKHNAETLFLNTFKSLFEESDISVKNKFYSELRKHRTNKNVERIISKVINEDTTLQNTWRIFAKHGTLNTDINLKAQLLVASDFEYNHKCLSVYRESDSECVINKMNSSNFDFADIDTLFEAESDSEPACKKVKLDTSDIEDIIARLENDATLLMHVKENVTRDYKDRVRGICEKLRNIVDGTC